MTQNPHPPGALAFFGGKVQRIRLPALPPSESPRVSAPKRITLPTGELAQLTGGETDFRYIACLELREGTLRGNHRHERKQESLYLMSGAASVHALNPETGERAIVDLQPGDLIRIAPGIAHALVVHASGMAVEFAPEPFDPMDTQPFPVVSQKSHLECGSKAPALSRTTRGTKINSHPATNARSP
ncbi:MAG: cupin domain-containing protein [Verrucomicrobiota bacterium]